jgi:hypothetical protein
MTTREYSDAWLCDDCTIVAVNDDTSGIESDERIAEVRAGLDRIGNISCNDDSETGEGQNEFSSSRCDACKSHLAGSRTRFAVWTE